MRERIPVELIKHYEEKLAYVICDRCKREIKLIVFCRHQAPIVFKATCQHCGRTNVYTFADIVEKDPEFCEKLRRAKEEAIREITLQHLEQLLDNIFRSLDKTIKEIKKKLQ